MREEDEGLIHGLAKNDFMPEDTESGVVVLLISQVR